MEKYRGGKDPEARINVELYGETSKPATYNGFVIDANAASCQVAKSPATPRIGFSFDPHPGHSTTACSEFKFSLNMKRYIDFAVSRLLELF